MVIQMDCYEYLYKLTAEAMTPMKLEMSDEYGISKCSINSSKQIPSVDCGIGD